MWNLYSRSSRPRSVRLDTQACWWYLKVRTYPSPPRIEQDVFVARACVVSIWVKCAGSLHGHRAHHGIAGLGLESRSHLQRSERLRISVMACRSMDPPLLPPTVFVPLPQYPGSRDDRIADRRRGRVAPSLLRLGHRRTSSRLRRECATASGPSGHRAAP